MGETAYRPGRFYFVMGVVAILVVAAGFGASFRHAVSGARTFTPLVHLHAAVFLAWLLLYLVQAGLVVKRRVAVHRWLGFAGAALGVAVVGVGCATAVAAARRGYDLPLDDSHDPLRFLAFTLGDMVSFTVLVGLAVWYRRRPEIHKRFMLLALLGPMMAAALVHLWVQLPLIEVRPPLFLASMAGLLFTGAVYDRVTRGRFHPVTLWGAVALFVWGNLRALVIGPSDAWHRFAAWLIQ